MKEEKNGGKNSPFFKRECWIDRKSPNSDYFPITLQCNSK